MGKNRNRQNRHLNVNDPLTKRVNSWMNSNTGESTSNSLVLPLSKNQRKKLNRQLHKNKPHTNIQKPSPHTDLNLPKFPKRTGGVSSWINSNMGELTKNSHKHRLERPIPRGFEREIDTSDEDDEVKVKNEVKQEPFEDQGSRNQDISQFASTSGSSANPIIKNETVKTEINSEPIEENSVNQDISEYAFTSDSNTNPAVKIENVKSEIKNEPIDPSLNQNMSQYAFSSDSSANPVVKTENVKTEIKSEPV